MTIFQSRASTPRASPATSAAPSTCRAVAQLRLCSLQPPLRPQNHRPRRLPLLHRPPGQQLLTATSASGSRSRPRSWLLSLSRRLTAPPRPCRIPTVPTATAPARVPPVATTATRRRRLSLAAPRFCARPHRLPRRSQPRVPAAAASALAARPSSRRPFPRLVVCGRHAPRSHHASALRTRLIPPFRPCRPPLRCRRPFLPLRHLLLAICTPLTEKSRLWVPRQRQLPRHLSLARTTL